MYGQSFLRLIVDLENPSRRGISLTGTLREAINLADTKISTLVKRQISRQRLVYPQETFSLFLYGLRQGTLLPHNIHVTRDLEWTENQETPCGHHTITSTYGCRTGLAWVDGPLKELNGEISSCGYCFEIQYKAKKVDDRVTLERVGVEKGAAWEPDCGEAEDGFWGILLQNF
jgi:hypothetical protein